MSTNSGFEQTHYADIQAEKYPESSPVCEVLVSKQTTEFSVL